MQKNNRVVISMKLPKLNYRLPKSIQSLIFMLVLVLLPKYYQDLAQWPSMMVIASLSLVVMEQNNVQLKNLKAVLGFWESRDSVEAIIK